MCGVSLEKLIEIVEDQDHEEFLDKLDLALSTMEDPDELFEYDGEDGMEIHTRQEFMLDDYLL